MKSNLIIFKVILEYIEEINECYIKASIAEVYFY